MNMNEVVAHVKAGEAVQKGDLITVDDRGRGFWAADPASDVGATRPLSRPETVVTNGELSETIFVDVDAADTSNQAGLASAHLPGGNYALLYTAQGKIKASVFDPNGTIVGSSELAEANADVHSVALAALTSTSFAAAFSSGETGVLTVAILNMQGVPVAAPMTVPDTEGATSFGVAPVAGGGFVVAWATANDRQPMFALYGADGAAQSNPTAVDTVDNPITNHQCVGVAALTSGGFAIAYGKGNGLSGFVFAAVYNAGGTRLTDLMAVGENISLSNDVGPFVTIAGLKNGGFAVTSYGGVGPGFQLNIFNELALAHGGTIILDSFDNGQAANRMALTCLKNGNVGVIWGGSGVCGAVYEPDGTCVFKRAGYGFGNGGVAIAAYKDGAAVAYQGMPDADGLEQIFVGFVDKNLYGAPAAVALAAGPRCSVPVVFPTRSPHGVDGLAMLVGVANDNIQLGLVQSYTQPMRVLVGVATAGAAKDENIPVQMYGDAKLRAPFKLPVSVDFNNHDVPGQRMAVVGDTAILKGIQS